MIVFELFILIGMIICFSKRTFGGHVKFQLALYSLLISNIVDFDDLARRQFGKYILDFENILNDIFSSLSK